MKPPVDYYNLNEISPDLLRRVTVVPRCQNEWLFVEDADGRFFLPETAVMKNETAEQAVLRCLTQYTGSVGVTLIPVCIFHDADYGLLYLAELNSKPLAPRISFFRSIPNSLADPRCCPFHFEWVQWWLSMQSSADELWDIYDENRMLTGRTQRRGDPLPHGFYHLVVHVWIQNPDGTILLTQRAPNKGHPLLWECSGGSALAGDNSLSAALREVSEETGIQLEAERGSLILTDQREGFICDVWLFHQDVSRCTLRLQPNETVDFRFADKNELIGLNRSSALVPYVYFDSLLNFL